MTPLLGVIARLGAVARRIGTAAQVVGKLAGDHAKKATEHAAQAARIAKRTAERIRHREPDAKKDRKEEPVPRDAPTGSNPDTIEEAVARAGKALDGGGARLLEAVHDLGGAAITAIDFMIRALKERDAKSDEAEAEIPTKPETPAPENPPEEKPEEKEENPTKGILNGIRSAPGSIKGTFGRLKFGGAAAGIGLGSVLSSPSGAYAAASSLFRGLTGEDEPATTEADRIVFEASKIVFTAAIESETTSLPETGPGAFTAAGDYAGPYSPQDQETGGYPTSDQTTSSTRQEDGKESRTPRKEDPSSVTFGEEKDGRKISSAAQKEDDHAHEEGASTSVKNDGENRIKMANYGTRNRDIQSQLKDVLNYAAAESGIDEVVVTSGGQTAERNPMMYKKPGGWVGTTRHNHGKAADLKLRKDKRFLNFMNPKDRPYFEAFARNSAKAGATGIGAGVNYMGGETMHVGFGTEATWGGAGWVSGAVSEGRRLRKGFDLQAWTKQREEEKAVEVVTGLDQTPPAEVEQKKNEVVVQKGDSPDRDVFNDKKLGEKSSERKTTAFLGTGNGKDETPVKGKKFAEYLGVDNEEQ